MIKLRVETGSPDCDRNIIERLFSKTLDGGYTIREEDDYLIIGVSEREAAIARYELNMYSFRIA
jgi:hypothetical protein